MKIPRIITKIQRNKVEYIAGKLKWNINKCSNNVKEGRKEKQVYRSREQRENNEI